MYVHINRACFVAQSEDILILLGGSAKPTGRLKYDSNRDQWDDALLDLPFNVKDGACLTMHEMKGNIIFYETYEKKLMRKSLQMIVLLTERHQMGKN